MDFKFKGEITKIFDIASGKTANGEWKAVEFLVTELNNVEYPQSCVFRLFGSEKVDNFMQYNKVGDYVDVSFNIKVNPSKQGSRYFNNIDAWKVFKLKRETVAETVAPPIELEEEDDLPF